MIQDAEILLSSRDDFEKLVSQIQIGNEVFCLITHDADHFEIIIGGHPDGSPWVFKFDEFIETIQEAKRALVGRT